MVARHLATAAPASQPSALHATTPVVHVLAKDVPKAAHIKKGFTESRAAIQTADSQLEVLKAKLKAAGISEEHASFHVEQHRPAQSQPSREQTVAGQLETLQVKLEQAGVKPEGVQHHLNAYKAHFGIKEPTAEARLSKPEVPLQTAQVATPLWPLPNQGPRGTIIRSGLSSQIPTILPDSTSLTQTQKRQMSSQAAPSQNPEFVPTNHQISDWMKDIIMTRAKM
jgi:hypothetical protein